MLLVCVQDYILIYKVTAKAAENCPVQGNLQSINNVDAVQLSLLFIAVCRKANIGAVRGKRQVVNSVSIGLRHTFINFNSMEHTF